MAQQGGGGGPDWQGLLKWSLANADISEPAEPISEEDRKWFMEAMQANTVDIVGRMKEITLVMKTPEDVLQAQGVTPENIEDMLGELQEHVESIDMANDLHSIGGLPPLLAYLKNSNVGIRAKAAEVVSTVVQNNPKGQQLVMESNGLEPLMSNFTSDPNTTSRAKALGAISALIRDNQPGITAFRLGNGFGALRDALSSDDARLQRKALHLVQYLLRHNELDRDIATELGFPRIMTHLVSSEDSTVREAALAGLVELAARGKAGLAGEERLKGALEGRIRGITAMSPEELPAAREERQLVDDLWSKCYNEPSSLREQGLVMLPGEETYQIPPDVVGKLFEPPLRGLAAAAREPPPPAPEDESEPGASGAAPPPM